MSTILSIATFGAGCFWCVEAVFEQLDGVHAVESGYMGGEVQDPTYREICSGTTGHAEITQIHYDPQIISYETLLDWLWRSHDPTTLNRQGADTGTQYRSAIFYHSEAQREAAEASKVTAQEDFTAPIVTEITAATTYYPAEDYHQDYLKKNPNGYCPDLSTGIVFDQKEKNILDNSYLLAGKQILILDSQDYCPYCEKLKNDVTDNYKGSIQMSHRTSDQLHGLQIISPTWATPSIIFLEDGKEVFAHQGLSLIHI